MGFEIYVIGVTWSSPEHDSGYNVHIVVAETREQAINIIKQQYPEELLLEYDIIKETPVDRPKPVYEINEPRNVFTSLCEC